MHKSALLLFSFFALCTQLAAQKITGRLRFEQNKTLTIKMDMKTTIAQQAGGQAIDFTVTGSAIHSFKATNTTDDNTTLHHELQRIAFDFDGMGQKVSYDPDNKKKHGMFGQQFNELLEKKYDVIIDPAGKTLRAIPEKIELTKQDERMVIITNMLKDLTGVVYPPAKGSASFFSVLPGYEVGIGDSWTETLNTDSVKSTTVSTLSSLTDSTVIVSFKTNATVDMRSQMMGMEAATHLTNVITGTITLDRQTGIIREKTSVTDSHGSTEVMGTTLPLTGKTTITIRVEKE